MVPYDKYHLSRCDAMEWLAEHYPFFPTKMPNVPLRASWVSESLFQGWAFVELEDGELVFADCLSPCIRSADMLDILIPH